MNMFPKSLTRGSSSRSTTTTTTSSFSSSHSHSYSHSRKSTDDFVNHYGRHSNGWLFGGFSLRGTFKDGVERLRHLKEDWTIQTTNNSWYCFEQEWLFTMLALHYRFETGPGPVSPYGGIHTIHRCFFSGAMVRDLAGLFGRGEDILDSGHKRSRTESTYPIHRHEEGDWNITVNITVMMGWICRWLAWDITKHSCIWNATVYSHVMMKTFLVYSLVYANASVE